MHRNRHRPTNDWDLYSAAFSGHHALRQVKLVESSSTGTHHPLQTTARQQDFLDDCEARGLKAFEACPFYLGERMAARLVRLSFPSLRLIALLRNPRERTISAFNDYVRVGRIRGERASTEGMEEMLQEKLAMLDRGEHATEDFEVRIVTSGIYIYGLEEWGRQWPSSQLLVLRSEDLFLHTGRVMSEVHSFLGLDPRSSPKWEVKNRNLERYKSRATGKLEGALDLFFAPYNARLYSWLHRRGIDFQPWPNATA